MVRYFDNAATSWPKPKRVLRGMKHYFTSVGGNPGRSGHRLSVEAGRVVLDAREEAAALFGLSDPSSIVFTKNATEAINTVLYGLFKSGDGVVTTTMEHNSVLRPLMDLKEKGIVVTIVPADEKGILDPGVLMNAVDDRTKLVVCTHASNVTGGINDIERIGLLCRARGVFFMVDAAQTAGVLPLDISRLQVDFLAASGHKGLLGPQGTGLLYLRDPGSLRPLTRGGTGSLSDREYQPDFMPDKFESGTVNVIGMAGLAEGIRYVRTRGTTNIHNHEKKLLSVFLEEVSSNGRIDLYGPLDPGIHTGVLSINIRRLSPSKVGELLDAQFGVLTRIGLHCAPGAHKTLGTFPDGTVRFSWGPFTREKDVMYAAHALKKIAEQNGKVS